MSTFYESRTLNLLVAFLIALLVALAGCSAGGQASAPQIVPTPTAAAGPEQTVGEVMAALAAKDRVTLLGLFDDSTGNLKQAYVDQAIDRWDSMQTKTRIPVPSALGPIQSRQVQPTEQRGASVLVPVLITYEIGTGRWEFTLRQTEAGWRLIEIRGRVLEQRQP